ncbi:helix-turn-helix transcriptional regulator [Mycetocola zhadangensis]|uniref:LuxR family transcriptional regulator n=1 Tax=Mycetocola zhadangensis TaxID=1164595 RepID=A0A3L7J6J8_9MICO|nr:AAA family ATPase [Mycetocola zhadangensis]RLQ84132.1 LuxR family transcriptional regulator [Mycetocola zhadangensis]GGE95893.1 hypothetical protein GCM10011313_18520 [Mycetocola zhadangensis]
MEARGSVPDPVLVGRDAELAVLRAILERASGGDAATLLVTGDPGVGKTALVRGVKRLAGSVTELYGTCLPLTSLSVPFLALRSAVRNLSPDDGPPPPRVTDTTMNVPVLIDTWLDELCAIRPVVLTVDDLQWADQSTLDVLMYLIAGRVRRPLTILCTIRKDDSNLRLQRWLADIRRLPEITELVLQPLDRIATGEQMAKIFDSTPHQSLVDEVYSHTRGNAYLTRLVVSGLSANARHIRSNFPDDLRSAVLQSWRQLSPEARRLAQTLAVNGGPMSVNDLEAVSGVHDILPLLAEAVDAGTVDAAPNGTYWFHHPLIAEVLERSLAPDSSHRWHARFADYYEGKLSDGPGRIEVLVAVADHHDRAGHAAEALDWALQAAEEAGDSGGRPEMLRLLRRAVALRKELPDASASVHDLLVRLRAAADAAGAHEEELGAIEQLLENPDLPPLDVAEMLVRRMHLRFSTGRAFLSVPEARAAVDVARSDASSWQYALALAELAHAELWAGVDGASARAADALDLALSAGHPRAMSYAHSAMAMAVLFDQHNDAEAFDHASKGLEEAVDARDWWAYVHAASWEAHALETWTAQEFANHLSGRRERLSALNAPHTYLAYLSAEESSSRLAFGDWMTVLGGLRVVLGSDPGAVADATARLTAARLSAWQGHTAEAHAHLERADELFGDKSEFLALPFDAVRSEVALAQGNNTAAFDAALAGATFTGLPPMRCEWLVPLAASALANLIGEQRDAGQDPTDLIDQLDGFVAQFPAVIRHTGAGSDLYDRQCSALEALYAAEVARGRAHADLGIQWVNVADRFADARLPWEETYACWRAAESLLTRGHHHRDQAASVLRRGVDLSERLSADPLGQLLLSLAETARVPLGHVEQAGTSRLPEAGLTPREHEILDHVIAGRTYSEIARALVISEKTVSSHISNLLRKTGTANRVDLARFASRTLRE